MPAVPSTGNLRTTVDVDVAVAVAASIEAREAAERELHRSRTRRSHAADALEHSAQRPGCSEAERDRLRSAYAAADRIVAERQADYEQAREVEHAWTVVAATYVPPAPPVRDSRGSALRGDSTLGRTRRPKPVMRPRGARPRTV